jgi:hypothetical protein
MGYDLQIDTEFVEPLATIRGLGDLRRWVESLRLADAPSLKHLLEYGWTGRFAELREELARALRENAPADETVRKTAANMLRMLEEVACRGSGLHRRRVRAG